MRHLVRFFSLSLPEKGAFFQAIFLICYFGIALKTSSLGTLLRSVNNTPLRRLAAKDLAIPPKRLAWLLVAAGRLLPFGTCLTRALAGKVLLSKNGHPARLHIGVRRDRPQGFEAHAWLSLDGKIILGKIHNLDYYRQFPSLTDRDES